jgi:Protein of unknown function (DUF664)
MDEVKVAPERPALEQMVDLQRAEVGRMLEGLDEEQARRRLVPSLTTPLGLVKHLTFVERIWFEMRLSGRTRAECGLPETVDESFLVDPADTVASVLAAHAAACEASRRVAADLSLETTVEHPSMGTVDLRWIYLHLVREIARHVGHGDILQEQLIAEADAESES